MKDFPPDGTRVRLVQVVNDPYFSAGIRGGELGVFTRTDPSGYRTHDNGYVTLTPPVKEPDSTWQIESQWARPEDIELAIPTARTHR